jgi:hypothetical protein
MVRAMAEETELRYGFNMDNQARWISLSATETMLRGAPHDSKTGPGKAALHEPIRFQPSRS